MWNEWVRVGDGYSLPCSAEDQNYGRYDWQSEPVLGQLKSGRMVVVYAVYTEDEESLGVYSGHVDWLTDCAENWNVTGDVVCWAKLPPRWEP